MGFKDKKESKGEQLEALKDTLRKWQKIEDGSVEHTTASAKAMNLLDNMGLRARANHRPATMSGGEQQRVAIARALANDPALLLADEPTGNLDPDTSDRVFDALVGLAREQGLAGVIATHNMALAAKMDRVLRLDHGALGPA